MVLSLRTDAREAVRVERADYHGWPAAYRMTNGTVDLVFVPQIGRIMRYGLVGGPNVLWENAALAGKTVAPDAPEKEWVNFGGDKLWPGPQSRWGWPPDPYLDRGEHTVEVLKDGTLRVTGPASAKSGVRFSREIRLESSGTGVRLRNRMINTGAEPVEWSVWEVAQVNEPEEACLPLNKAGQFPEGFMTFKTSPPLSETIRLSKDRVCLTRHAKQGGKIGADSPEGWTEARVAGLRFRISAPFERGKSYPDGCPQQVWSNPDPLKYMELELLSPIRRLAPGKEQELTTRWKLER